MEPFVQITKLSVGIGLLAFFSSSVKIWMLERVSRSRSDAIVVKTLDAWTIVECLDFQRAFVLLFIDSRGVLIANQMFVRGCLQYDKILVRLEQ